MTPEPNKFDAAIINLPPGYRADLALISYFKHELVSCELTVGERLRMLEAIEGCVRGPLTAAAITAVEPANEALAAVITQAIRAAAGSEDGAPCFDILDRTFEDLMALNPSIRQAVTLCCRRR
jgi:hypothetical protein